MTNSPESTRDLRIDFCRGLALLFIFIDHVPGNRVADFTLKNFGFADAAEVFVLLAGFSALLAYGRVFDGDGFIAGAKRVGSRVLDLYVWHIATIAMSLLLLACASVAFSYPNYLNYIGLHHFISTPGTAISQAALLYYQQNMLNILPLYIVLLAWFPAMFWLLRKSHALVLGVSAAIWFAAYVTELQLPGHPSLGWFFNPFSWQLLMTLGAVAADRVRSGKPLYEAVLLPPAIMFVAFAALLAAPWTRLPGLENTRLLPADLIGGVDKTRLSPWRFLHIIALGYVVAYCVPSSARWLKSSVAGIVVRCGQHSLEIFCLGTILSFSGWVLMREAGPGFGTQVIVNTVGLFVLGVTAWSLAQRKLGRRVLPSWSVSVPFFSRGSLQSSR